LFPEPRDPFLKPWEEGPFFLNDARPTMPAVAAAKMTVEELRGEDPSPKHAARMREQKAIKDAAAREVFDAAVAAEAKRLDRTLTRSTEFANAVGPGLKKQGFKAGRDTILNSVRRLVLARTEAARVRVLKNQHSRSTGS
jgi:hypothetical protein